MPERFAEQAGSAIQQTWISARDAYAATAFAWTVFAIAVWYYPTAEAVVVFGIMAVAGTIAAYLASGAYERYPQ